MNVIVRSKIFCFINDFESDCIEIYTFKKSDDCFNRLKNVMYDNSNNSYRTKSMCNKIILNNYIEVEEFNLDFENHRFYINGNTRYFKFKYSGDYFVDKSSDVVNEELTNINLSNEWMKSHTYEYIKKGMFGKVIQKHLLCKDCFVIPTTKTIPISYKHMNITREIKLIEY